MEGCKVDSRENQKVQAVSRFEYVYVASSWRNLMHPAVVETFRAVGVSCYDFKRDEGAQFDWSEVDPAYKETWDRSVDRFKRMLSHDRAIEGFRSDYGAMQKADAFVLVHPAGRSSHLELGWAWGRGIPTALYAPEGMDEPDLMYSGLDLVTDSMMVLLEWAGVKD